MGNVLRYKCDIAKIISGAVRQELVIYKVDSQYDSYAEVGT